MKFVEFCDLFSEHWTDTTASQRLIEKLTDMFSRVDPTEAQYLAYLCTGRIGAPYAPRVGYTSATEKDFYDRLQRDQGRDSGSVGNRVTVSEVYHVLHAMDRVRPDWYPNTPNTSQALIHLAGLMNEHEFKWLVNIMMGRRVLADRLVIESLVRSVDGDVTVVKAIMARFNKSTPDIGILARCILQSGIAGALHEVGRIHYGIPVPMEEMDSRFGRDGIPAAYKRCGSEHVFVQAKSDGVYLQLQKNGDSIWVFDEQGLDLASFLPRYSTAKAGTEVTVPHDAIEFKIAKRISEIVELVKNVPIERVVLDAELVGISASGVVSQDRTFHADGFQLLVFDAIATEVDIRIKPYSERRDLMIDLLGPTRPNERPGIYMADEISARSSFEVTRRFDEFLSKGRYEGIVLKSSMSRLSKTYRWTQSRIKVKNYVTLDVLLVGCYYNHKKGMPTQYLGALKDPNSEEFVPCVILVASAGDQSRSLEREINNYCQRTKSQVCAPDVVNDGNPTWWTDASLVVEVESDGLRQRNNDPRLQHVQWTLHQPGQRAIVGIRRDKLKNRVNTTERLLSLDRAPGH